MSSALSPDDFDALMAPLGPFEPAPVLAVAVSGGADSLALALLADAWARARGGHAVALTVDHRLRPDSSAEAARVAAWLSARCVAHETLCWDGPKPMADIQAEARAARYRLLGEWCLIHGVLHLLLGHHRADQAETLLLRLGRGSGVDGLAAMTAIRPTPWGRLLRPLLDVAPERLRSTLVQAGQEWIEDPSNRNDAFGRVRMRRLMPDLAAEGLSEARLAATARRLGRAREALEGAVSAAVAEHVTLHPAGFALIDAAVFRRLPDEIGLRLLARLLMSVAGGGYAPRLDRLEALHAALAQGALDGGRTLAGCRIVPLPAMLLICREPAKVQPPVPLVAGQTIIWDARFRVAAPAGLPPGLSLGALGAQGWRRVAAALRPAILPMVPAAARPTLPAVYGNDGISAVPHLGYNRIPALDGDCRWIVAAPNNPLTVAGRRLV